MKDTTIIICCAGMGTRLGIGTTKCLIDICDEPLIIKLLKQLEKCDDIRIVVGYQAENVINTVTQYRKDIMFAFNYEYKTNGPAASMSKALQNVKENVVILDGDLVMPDGEIDKLFKINENCIGYCKKISDEPILIDVRNNKVHKFNVKKSNYEWPGIVKINKKDAKKGEKYIYDTLKSKLPMKAIYIDAHGIDTQDDYERVINWINKNYKN